MYQQYLLTKSWQSYFNKQVTVVTQQTFSELSKICPFALTLTGHLEKNKLFIQQNNTKN